MSKLITDREVGLMKGLFKHEKLNDQQVQSIFSYLHRNINHREIGAVRKAAKPQYAAISAAPKGEVDQLLAEYSKVQSIAHKFGFCELDEISQQVHKSIEIMKTAVLVYNNLTISTRSESFIVLSVIAWTYALHAFYRSSGIDPVYVDKEVNQDLADGKPRLWDLSRCITDKASKLSIGEANNLRYIVAIRNEVEHRTYEDINESVQSKLQATVLNFVRFCEDRFGKSYNFSADLAFAIQLRSIKLSSSKSIKVAPHLSKSVIAVNKLLEEGMTAAEYNDPSYAFRVYVVPKVTNNSKNADQAVSYAPIGSEVEMAIKQVERPKFRAGEAVSMLRNQGLPVSSHTFVQAWKGADLKNPGKGLAIELGNQWFWYQEGIDEIAKLLIKAPA